MTRAPIPVSFASTALRLAALAAAGAAALFVPEAFAAGGGTPIDEAAGNAVDIAQGLGGLAAAAGVMATCAGGMLRSSGLMAGGATTAVCGGAWAGAPDVVEQVIGGGAGAGLSDLASLPAADGFGTLAMLLVSLVG